MELLCSSSAAPSGDLLVARPPRALLATTEGQVTPGTASLARGRHSTPCSCCSVRRLPFVPQNADCKRTACHGNESRTAAAGAAWCFLKHLAASPRKRTCYSRLFLALSICSCIAAPLNATLPAPHSSRGKKKKRMLLAYVRLHLLPI